MTNRASFDVSMSMHNQTKHAPSGPISTNSTTTVMVVPTEADNGLSQHSEESYQHYYEHHHHSHAHHAHHHHHHHHGYHPAVAPSTPPCSDGHGYHHEVDSITSTSSSASGCRCSNRLLTGIVITILPIAITSTLICVFMMQKTNLHQYAIYSFVIFCAAFVFPFALFFFTVVLNKIYKFYKREFLQSTSGPTMALPPGESCDIESVPMPLPEPVASSTSSGYHHNLPAGLGRVIIAPTGEHHQSPNGHAASLICYPTSRLYHPYYYQIEDGHGGTIVAFAPTATPEGPPPPLIIEDNPPSYEMALLCPSVNSHSAYQGTMQVLLHKQSLEPSKEKPTCSEADTSTHSREDEVEDDHSSHHSTSDPSLGSLHEPITLPDDSSIQPATSTSSG